MTTCPRTGKVAHATAGAAWKSLKDRRRDGVLGLDWNVYACGSHFHTGHKPGHLAKRIKRALRRKVT